MARKPKTTKVTLVVDAEIDTDFITDYPQSEFESDLIGEVVKVKSGPFENIMIGWISSAKVTK